MMPRILVAVFAVLHIGACSRDGEIAKDYDECMLKHVSNAASQSAVLAVKSACKQKYPKVFDFAEIAKTANVPAWSVIATSPKYRELSREQRVAARIQYIEDVIEPRVHPEFKSEAFAQFAAFANRHEPVSTANQIDKRDDLKQSPLSSRDLNGTSNKVAESAGKNALSSKDYGDKLSNVVALPVALPENGFEVISPSDQRIAPLSIVTRSSDQSFYVKLEDSVTRQQVLGVFLRAGASVRTKVPLGTFRLKYASGREWFGEKLLFGPETGYFKADKEFVFRASEGKISGYTVELFLQRDGNLHTSAISQSQW